jgi:hypothetical protein
MDDIYEAPDLSSHGSTRLPGGIVKNVLSEGHSRRSLSKGALREEAGREHLFTAPLQKSQGPGMVFIPGLFFALFLASQKMPLL